MAVNGEKTNAKPAIASRNFIAPPVYQLARLKLNDAQTYILRPATASGVLLRCIEVPFPVGKVVKPIRLYLKDCMLTTLTSEGAWGYIIRAGHGTT